MTKSSLAHRASPIQFADCKPAAPNSSALSKSPQLSVTDGGSKDAGQRTRGFGALGSIWEVVSHPTVAISPPNVVTRRSLTGHGMTAESLHCTEANSVTFRFCAPLHLLVAYEQGERTAGETFVEGLPPSKLRNLARRLTFVPAGHEYREWHEPGTRSRLTLFYFDPALLPTALGLRPDDSKFAPRLLFEDLTLWHAAMKLNSLLEDVSSAGRSYFQALGTVLVYELIHSSREQPAARQLRGGLAGWQQRIITAYIEEHLPKRMPLSTLAQLVRLSRYHFCRAFKQSFGVSPQRYQNDRRIEYAKRLLANPDLSVTEVALQVGFGSSTSFAAAFRKITGLSPSTYSRSL
jgi:AraC-like DNA-binding protein